MNLRTAAKQLAAHPDTAELGREALSKLDPPDRRCKVCNTPIPENDRRGRPVEFCSAACRLLRTRHHMRAQYLKDRRAIKVGRRILEQVKEAG